MQINTGETMKTTLTKEQSQHLIDLGVPKEKASDSWHFKPVDVYYPIFTLSDLLEILPPEIWNFDIEGNMQFSMVYENGKWNVSYTEEYYERHKCCIGYSKEELVDALYELCVWTIENGYLKF